VDHARLIDAHRHVSYGYPLIRAEGKARHHPAGILHPQVGAQRAEVPRWASPTPVPGGTWFTDVGIHDAIRLGLMEGCTSPAA
jgi:hypothetical protein